MPGARNTGFSSEKRAQPRRPTSRKVYLISGRQALRCALVDVADGGARVRVAGGMLPEGDLYLVDTRVRRIHLTRSVWQSDREAGLRFVASDTLDEPAGSAESATEAALLFARRRAKAGVDEDEE